jgi:hypothetical protein
MGFLSAILYAENTSFSAKILLRGEKFRKIGLLAASALAGIRKADLAMLDHSANIFMKLKLNARLGSKRARHILAPFASFAH